MSSTTPPDPYGSGDESDRSSGAVPPPPAGDGSRGYGTTPPPPPSGSTPAYGSTSGYGSTPSSGDTSYGSTPPAYGSTPPAYGSTPPAYGSTQPSYGGGDFGQSPYGYGFPRNNLGVWSLVLGLVGVFVCGLFAGIPAIVLGHKARGAVAEGQANNPGMATAGIVLGWIATILSLLGLIIVVIAIATGGFVGLQGVDPNSF